MLKEIIGASLTSPLKGGLKTQKQVQTCTLNKITTPTSLFVGGAFFFSWVHFSGLVSCNRAVRIAHNRERQKTKILDCVSKKEQRGLSVIAKKLGKSHCRTIFKSLVSYCILGGKVEEEGG
jgi:hypothetical protein